MRSPISISAISSVSALGTSSEEVWQSYLEGQATFRNVIMGQKNVLASVLTNEAEGKLDTFGKSAKYKNVDRTVLMALVASEKLRTYCSDRKNVGINIGSSRGATTLFENYFRQFERSDKVSAYTSPTTTLGNISSWVGQELSTSGVRVDHSVTCSTSLHALLNGIAWLQSNMSDGFIVGGVEAAITPFTIAQMEALKLYSKKRGNFPCESMLITKKRNTMILGEGCALAFLEKGVNNKTLATISGYGIAMDRLEHNSSISDQGVCFQQSMRAALVQAELDTVDAVILHSPGTVKGDIAEMQAIESVFKNELPLLTSNKWMIGHTFAASGMMSVELAVLMLQKNRFIENPFYKNEGDFPETLQTIMINAVGFGGNAVSIIVGKI